MKNMILLNHRIFLRSVNLAIKYKGTPNTSQPHTRTGKEKPKGGGELMIANQDQVRLTY